MSQEETTIHKPLIKIRVSPKSKLILFLCYFFGFFIGLHAFYVGKFKKGLFYAFSIGVIFAYYTYILHFLSTNKYTSWLNLKFTTWFSVYLIFNVVVQYIPFLGWTAYFGSYLIFLFFIALILSFIDCIMILCGQYKDTNGLKVVSKKYKQKHQHEILEY